MKINSKILRNSLMSRLYRVKLFKQKNKSKETYKRNLKVANFIQSTIKLQAWEMIPICSKLILQIYSNMAILPLMIKMKVVKKTNQKRRKNLKSSLVLKLICMLKYHMRFKSWEYFQRRKEWRLSNFIKELDKKKKPMR